MKNRNCGRITYRRNLFASRIYGRAGKGLKNRYIMVGNFLTNDKGLDQREEEFDVLSYW